MRRVLHLQNRSNVRTLLRMLEEYVTDDISATEARLIVHDLHPSGNLAVELHYDGLTHSDHVESIWQALQDWQTTPPHPAPVRYTRSDHRDNAAVLQSVGARQRQRRLQRQQEPPPEPAAAGKFQIDWNAVEVWQTPTATTRLGEMSDDFLWSTLIWIVRNKDTLCEEAGQLVKNGQPPALQACCWLRDAPLFRALLRESIQRALTYPRDVYDYFKRYVLDRQGTLDGYQPWRDPNLAHQVTELQTLTEIAETGRASRVFHLE